MLRIRFLLVFLLAPLLAGLVVSALSGYASSTSSFGPGGPCGLAGETTVSGFPWYYRVQDSNVGITARNCTTEFSSLDGSFFSWTGFFLDTLFYTTIGYAVGLSYLAFRSRLNAYYSSKSSWLP